VSPDVKGPLVASLSASARKTPVKDTTAAAYSLSSAVSSAAMHYPMTRALAGAREGSAANARSFGNS